MAVLRDGTQLSPTRPFPHPLTSNSSSPRSCSASCSDGRSQTRICCTHDNALLSRSWKEKSRKGSLCRRRMRSETHQTVGNKRAAARVQVREDLCLSSGVSSLGHACHMEPGFEGGLEARLRSYHDHWATLSGHPLRSPGSLETPGSHLSGDPVGQRLIWETPWKTVLSCLYAWGRLRV